MKIFTLYDYSIYLSDPIPAVPKTSDRTAPLDILPRGAWCSRRARTLSSESLRSVRELIDRRALECD